MNTETSIQQPDTWIKKIPELWELVWVLYCLALDYQFKWASYWPDRWEDFPWVKRAMAHTYARLNAEDKEILREGYEAFLENDKVCNWQAIANPVHTAVCYILWGEYHKSRWKSPDDRRVYHNGQAQMICTNLPGDTKEEALKKLDTRCYEFKEWW